MDLDSAEGRVAALRRCVPMVGQIKDPTLRDEYARQLAGWVGWADVAQVIEPGARARRRSPINRTGATPDPRPRAAHARTGATRPRPTGVARPDPRDPTLWPQREALKSALQYPALAGPVFDALTVESFTHPGYAAVRAAIDAAGGTRPASPERNGSTRCDSGPRRRDRRPDQRARGRGHPGRDDEKLPRYIAGVLARLQEVWMGRQIAEVKSKLQRMSPIEQGDEYHALFGDLVAMEAYRRSLLEQASGDDLTA